ncbi:TonB-dependent receptor [uncultured Sphingomonas sp.]|uniref:TonB-dependent receptor n=1 Tax=uncultured Sphingomonas sp. TaxID=158754 RepID=UPI0025EE0505|nr:TonB-dependent receptor [uncultured Sphingomonas sp.]
MRNRVLVSAVRPRAILIPIAVATLACPAMAQQADDTGVPDLVVTAQRRPEQAQDVGIALSVIDGSTLADRGVSTINQLQYQTPGLEAVPAFGGGQPQFRLRGVGFDDYASNNTSPVGVYVDDVAKPFPIQTQGLLFDLDRVEVLRGPQGTLYGRNTTAGAINFITARPSETTSAGFSGEYGRFDLFRAEGFLTGQLGEGLTGRIAAATEQGGGFQRNRVDGRRLGDADRWGTRGQLAYDNGAFDLLLEGHYARDTSEATGLYLFRALGTLPADTSRRATGWGGSAAFQAQTGIAPSAKPFRDNDTAGGHATATLDLDGVSLTSITAYEHFRRREYNDWDASAAALAGTYFNSRAKTFSQEVRLASDGVGDVKWVLGGYFADERLKDRFLSDFQDSLGFVARTGYRQSARTAAGFGQVDVTLAPQLTVTGGARVEREVRRLRDFTTVTSPVPEPGAGARLGTTQVSGKLAADYRLSPDVLFYASASRGVKSGGFTAYNTLTVDQLAPFKPEILYAYEVGAKSDLAGRRLRLNGSAFYYDYRRQQVQSAIYDTVYGAVGKIVNAPRSHIYGAEAELTWRPLAGLEVTQGIAWRKGKYDRFTDLDIAASAAAGQAVAIDRKGQDQGFPRWSYTGSLAYTAPVADDHAVTVETDYSYRDTLQPVLLGPVYRVQSYWIVNGSIGFGPRDGRWNIGVYGRNILNDHYDLTRNFFLGGIDIASPGRPASYGVKARVRF